MCAAESSEDTAHRAAGATSLAPAAQLPSGFPVRPRHHTYSMAWRADCIAHVQAGIAAGKTVGGMARELGMSDTTIVRWFIDAGLPMPAGTIDNERKARIIAEARTLRQQGMTLRRIAAELRCCEKRLSSWLRSEDHKAGDASRVAIVPGRKQRLCMTCRDPFPSDGPHHRMCLYCRTRAASASPYEPQPGGSTGRRVSVGRAA